MSDRREFLKTSGVASVVLAAGLPAVHAAGSDIIKVGVIGCGGRGSGAAENVVESSKGVEIVACGDYFREKAVKLGGRHKVPADHCYGGLDAYKQVIATPDVNYVILATPPGFRPDHLLAAVEAGKNIFTEKPVAVDGPGIRTCFKVYEMALQKGLGVGAGTQRRHQYSYLEVMKRIHAGEIGDIVGARAYWNQGPIWFRKRADGMSDLDYQINNWYHFCWMCGDHYVEQHVHNLDVVNWATKSHPVRAVGMGGRVNPCADPAVDGHIFNFFSVDFEYPNGVHVLSMARQIAGCENSVSEALVGTKGMCLPNASTINGQSVINRDQLKKSANPYVQEHTDLIASIRAGKPLNELKDVTESTLTAILGRMSAYTGKAITWEQALNSTEVLRPDLTSTTIKVSPVPVPGRTQFV